MSIWTHSCKVQCPFVGRNIMAIEASGDSCSHCICGRKQTEMNSDTQLAFPLYTVQDHYPGCGTTNSYDESSQFNYYNSLDNPTEACSDTFLLNYSRPHQDDNWYKSPHTILWKSLYTMKSKTLSIYWDLTDSYICIFPNSTNM